jgi:hypothetical protein
MLGSNTSVSGNTCQQLEGQVVVVVCSYHEEQAHQ